MISKILVGYDGTPCADKALTLAMDIAEKYAAELLILNVLEPQVYGTPEDAAAATSASMVGLIKDLQQAHQNTLAKAMEKAKAQKPNLKVYAELREGNPPNQIVDAAQEGSFDIVVVGHGGESRLREMFLGGTSERVAHLARCAVLIAK